MYESYRDSPAGWRAALKPIPLGVHVHTQLPTLGRVRLLLRLQLLLGQG